MKDDHLITECNFTRVAIRQLLDSLPLTTNPNDDLLMIDIRYDLSLIELLLRLKTLSANFPFCRCFFIVDPIRSKLPNHLTDDYIDSNNSLDDVHHKIKKISKNKNLLTCREHYTAIMHSINLTEAQMRVVRDITRGMSTHQIAKKHTLSIKTIYSHTSTIKEKLNISTRHNLFHYLAKNTSTINEIEINTISML
ncbi:helix-turn-helix transcriptional regulator [Serratia quinivorans]|uniref:helix-turn-helix transcriptional regulator n=1 Tax=Serratia quinivorans TaxID=137545 RepID=UPI00217A9D88|nr:LuxR C-terminal-related transcriptional regulator [Serratia quinivorans]CAI0967742.1 Bacterial regulatory proteins, luxR family [Serratia quinivorans]CAI1713906.1 Bacterial regulatory proteins, luxR family [Serratia quinivorans]